ncbi:MAG: peptide chain release factor N(5)-glutamine methyltransferase [Burkholderiaceae bacterium]
MSKARDPSAGELLAADALPRPEARALLSHVLGEPRERLIAHPERPIDHASAQRFNELVARRLAGEPLAYLLGAREFFGRSFEVSPAVLIPRPETELLVEVALELLAGRNAPRILELGTGSGCIAITLALERSDATVVATDISLPALAVARTNAETLGARVNWKQSDWFSDLERQAPFDLIVSNPPYVAAGDAYLDALAYEPTDALTDHGDGLGCLRTLAAAAPSFLAPDGWLVLEHGYDQARAVRGLLTVAALCEVGSRRDAAGIERVSLGRR